ncbi:hypothetical protein ACTTAF_00440 [Rhodobacter capsulatus]|uniref:hypothetical protein n=1 Tax=Rhodobacter capsulatus TaxID=1061 RepID=UPI0003D36BE7|nr:hypothetical protein [Rhodobacter capsulatus]ETD82878.1 hypothetical protein U703_10485 [Rhodobacter capsulatus YW1]
MSHPGCSSRNAFGPAPAPGSYPWTLLQILRLQIQSQIAPERHSWQRGLALASSVWGEIEGPQVFAALAGMLDRMGRSRRSMFRFSNPDCSGCAAVMTAHESLFLQIITLMWQRQSEKAERAAFLLCEANDISGLVQAATRLVQVLPTRAAARP